MNNSSKIVHDPVNASYLTCTSNCHTAVRGKRFLHYQVSSAIPFKKMLWNFIHTVAQPALFQHVHTYTECFLNACRQSGGESKILLRISKKRPAHLKFRVTDNIWCVRLCPIFLSNIWKLSWGKVNYIRPFEKIL